MVVIILTLNALKNLLPKIYTLQQVKTQNPQTKAKIIKCVLHVFKGKESFYHITFTITLLFIKVNQEPGYRLFLLPFGKKCNRETSLTIDYLLNEHKGNNTIHTGKTSRVDT